MPVMSALRPRAIPIRHIFFTTLRPSPSTLHLQTIRNQCSSTSKTRPTLPFYSPPSSNRTPSRTYASTRTKSWLRHEAKLLVRYAAISWLGAFCIFTIFYFIIEEQLERDFPTPHEWPWRCRKQLRDAHKWTDPKHRPIINWAKTLERARNLCLLFEDENLEGGRIPRLHGTENPDDEVPWEFIPHDISGMSEEWRRGYFETIMLTAKAAEHLDGWMRDVKTKVVSAPEYVIGPSNPRPKPIPPGSPHAPREEDCELAFPSADRYYMKALATKGLTPRQRMEAAFEYANFVEFKGLGGQEALYKLALADASLGLETLPYDVKTFVLRDGIAPPSLNVFDALTAIANHKARSGDVATALPIYLSLLKARRSLPTSPPPGSLRIKKLARESLHRQIINFFLPPDYPPPPPSGDLPPWRNAEERCQEASLNLYIGEILYSQNKRDDGLAWTRDGVDVAEEQMRSLPQGISKSTKAVKKVCRECLRTGLENWTTMVARLAREEEQNKGKGGGVLSFWRVEAVEGRWNAEGGVVRERVRRTRELVEESAPPDEGVIGFFKA